MLFREPKRRERHRRLVLLAFIVIFASGGAVIGYLAWGTSGPHLQSALQRIAKSPPPLPVGGYPTMKLAGPLAVAPDGRLYVADPTRDEILVRQASGKFRVVAGNGRTGFSGDGGLVIDAELSRVTDMTFAADGSLYFADGDRVRIITTDGIIETVAGNGEVGKVVAIGTPALAAPIGSIDNLSIALSPSGVLYISRFSQILRLVDGKLYATHADVPSGLLNGNFNYNLFDIAVTQSDDVYVSGFNGWSIWKIAPDGIASEIGPPQEARGSGGTPAIVERAPTGIVYAEGGSTLFRIERDELIPAVTLLHPVRAVRYFWLTNFAFAPDGVVYADEIPGGTGFEDLQQLIAVRNDHAAVVWQQHGRS